MDTVMITTLSKWLSSAFSPLLSHFTLIPKFCHVSLQSTHIQERHERKRKGLRMLLRPDDDHLHDCRHESMEFEGRMKRVILLVCCLLEMTHSSSCRSFHIFSRALSRSLTRFISSALDEFPSPEFRRHFPFDSLFSGIVNNGQEVLLQEKALRADPPLISPGQHYWTTTYTVNTVLLDVTHDCREIKVQEDCHLFSGSVKRKTRNKKS